MDEMLISRIAFVKVLDFKGNSPTLTLMVWVFIFSSLHFTKNEYSIFSFARGASELSVARDGNIPPSSVTSTYVLLNQL